MTVQDDLAGALSTYSDALREDDLDAVVACFTPDAVVMAPATPTASGAGVRDFYRAAMAASHLDIAFTIELVVGSDDEAAVFTHSTGTRAMPDGTTAPVHSREAFVLQRRAGAFAISRYLFNRLG